MEQVAPRPIRLVVTDVDGTLVRHDKTLAPETIAAVASLRAAGIKFCLVSSRPPTGLDVLVGPLGIDTPRAGFNGGLVLDPANRVVSQLTIEPAAAAEAVGHMMALGIDPWVFADGKWFLTNPHAHYIPRERLSIQQDFVAVPDLGPHLGAVHKIMGSATDFDLMARGETEIGALLAGRATVLRSQPYYLDVTHPQANKGYAAAELARLLGIDPAEMCCVGDMPNDTPMFEVAGLSVAMGNAPPDVQALADVVTGSNEETGWADAITQHVLGSRAKSGMA